MNYQLLAVMALATNFENTIYGIYLLLFIHLFKNILAITYYVEATCTAVLLRMHNGFYPLLGEHTTHVTM